MSYSTLDKLVFMASFMVLMNWGVRLFNVVLNYFQ